MDPAILELLRNGATAVGDEIEAILRLDRPHVELPGVRIVSRFGPIVTCRLQQDALLSTHAEEHVWSLKLPRPGKPKAAPAAAGDAAAAAPAAQ